MQYGKHHPGVTRVTRSIALTQCQHRTVIPVHTDSTHFPSPVQHVAAATGVIRAEHQHVAAGLPLFGMPNNSTVCVPAAALPAEPLRLHLFQCPHHYIAFAYTAGTTKQDNQHTASWAQPPTTAFTHPCKQQLASRSCCVLQFCQLGRKGPQCTLSAATLPRSFVAPGRLCKAGRQKVLQDERNTAAGWAACSMYWAT
jgi:hypothetical protein